MRYGKVGVTKYDLVRTSPGYTLFTPLIQQNTYLMNLDGQLVHKWALAGQPGNYAQLLPNGNLFVAITTKEGPTHLSEKGGWMVELDWHGKIVWEYKDHAQHHDFRRRPNGNTICLAWKLLQKTLATRVRGGRADSEGTEDIWGDYISEVKSAGERVGEWHADEHMKIEKYPNCSLCSRMEWAHPNSIWPLENGDVLVSWRHNHLIAVIDRNSKKLKWEWCDSILGHQHDFQELNNGNYMVFVNGTDAPVPNNIHV